MVSTLFGDKPRSFDKIFESQHQILGFWGDFSDFVKISHFLNKNGKIFSHFGDFLSLF